MRFTEEGGEVIFLAGLHADTVETGVFDTETFPAFIVIILLDTLCVQTHIRGVVRVDRVIHTYLEGTQ